MSEITWQSLNWFDCSILVILGLSIIISILRGFLREVLSLIVWLVAIIVALKYALPASLAMRNMISSPLIRYIIAFVLILFVILIIGMIVNSIVRRLMKQSPLGILDRLLGFFFGFGRGILLVGLVILLLQVSSLQDSPVIRNSKLTPQFNGVVAWLRDFLPQEIQQLSKWSKTSTADLLNTAPAPTNGLSQAYNNTIKKAAKNTIANATSEVIGKIDN